MQNPLREIFDVIYLDRAGYHPMTKEESYVWDCAQRILGGDMIDRLVYSQARSLTEAQYEMFREGFLLGIQLMLEVK